jgi:hypothetical protein
METPASSWLQAFPSYEDIASKEMISDSTKVG